MEGIIAPTDTRFRGDLRLHEEGKTDEAEIEKNEIEQLQRRKRRQMEERKEEHRPHYFEMVRHPFLKDNSIINTNEKVPVKWQLIQGPKGYWERRERGDWADALQLWGPFDKSNK